MSMPRLSAMLVGLAVAATGSLGAQSALADAAQDCRHGSPEARVIGCSNLLAEARTARQRAIALDGRCMANNDRSAFQEAVADCTNAVRADDAYPYTYSNRGIAQAALNNHAAAIQDFTRGYNLRPNRTWLLVSRAKSHAALGNTSLAIADYEEALRLKPDNEEARSGLEALRTGGQAPNTTSTQSATSSLCGSVGCN